ncbi:MAG: T9SS type A sorting domain-containing protein [Bacteroidia bacterium]|nr:T9SS type A sorting domain-containing protein [Bacteroidia bacterium]
MRKIYISLMFLCVFLNFSLVNAQTGATCATAQVIASLPFSQTGMSTASSGDNYDNTLPCSSGTYGGNYLAGNDYVFSFTPSSNQPITITLTNTGQAAAIFVTTACPDVAASCVAYSIESATAHSISNLNVTGGTLYYITISSSPTLPFFGAQTISFDISIVGCSTSDLPNASFTYTNTGAAYNFTNTSTGGTSYEWVFGDETLPPPYNWYQADTNANPSHTYAGDGTYLVQMVATNSCGTDTVSQSITVVGTAVSGIGGHKSLVCYPNPVSDLLNITSDNLVFDKAGLSIVNILGCEIYNETLSDISCNLTKQINLKNLAKGVYYLKLQTDKESFIHKFNVE